MNPTARSTLQRLILALCAFGCGLRAETALFSDHATAASAGDAAADAPTTDGNAPPLDASMPDAIPSPDAAVLCGQSACPTGYTCTDDPTDTCDPDGGPCPGRCLPGPTGKDCGGFAGFVCAADEWCDYDGQCPIADALGACRKRPTTTECPAVTPTTCAKPACSCNDGTPLGCDWCAALRSGLSVHPCP